MSTTNTTPAAPQKSNLRKLAEFIYDTGDADRIMAAFEMLAASGALDCLKKQPTEATGKEASV